MLQASIQNVSPDSDVYCNSFYVDVAYVLVAIHICCKWLFKMFHLFQTYVASVLSGRCICCSGYTYVTDVSPVSHVCCRSTSCCNISSARSRRMRRRSPRARRKRSRRGWSPRAATYRAVGAGATTCRTGTAGGGVPAGTWEAKQAWVVPTCICAAACGAIGAGATSGGVQTGACFRTLLLDLRNRNWKICTRD
jgi:hypothetical protein